MHETVRRAGAGCGEPKPCPGYTRLRLDAAGALDSSPPPARAQPHLIHEPPRTTAPQTQKPRVPAGRVIGVGVLLVVCAVAIGAAAAAGWVLDVAHSAPNLSKKPTINPGSPSQVFASDGSSMGYIYSPDVSVKLTYGEVPKLVRRATIAIEDRRFYQHGALDYEGIIRAAFKDIAHGSTALQGASTLTEQVVDNAYLPKSIDKDRKARNLKYKIEQAKLALQLEQKHSKRWILDQVPERGAVRNRRRRDRLRDRRRRPDVLRQTGREAADRPGGDAGRIAAGTEQVQPVPAPRGCPRASQPGAAGDGDRRRHQPAQGRRRSPAGRWTSGPTISTRRRPTRTCSSSSRRRPAPTCARTPPAQLPGAAPRG